MGWLRKILQKDYNVTTRTYNHHNQPPNNNIIQENGTEDWLQIVINELAKISGDISLTPIKILTGWGTKKNEEIWDATKKQVLENNLHRNRKA